MRFIADAMLGRLAKRLRLLGFDVAYDPALDDNAILRVALAEDRVILTRDTRLAERPLAARHLFVCCDRVRDQVRQVLNDTGTVPPGPLTRCSRCNLPLAPASRNDAEDRVPEHVLRTAPRFCHCDGCGRYYWKGSHVERMQLG